MDVGSTIGGHDGFLESGDKCTTTSKPLSTQSDERLNNDEGEDCFGDKGNDDDGGGVMRKVMMTMIANLKEPDLMATTIK